MPTRVSCMALLSVLLCVLQLAALLGVKRRAITIAPEATVSALTGFTSGVHPRFFNHHTALIRKSGACCHRYHTA